jgi:hypothetical protein
MDCSMVAMEPSQRQLRCQADPTASLSFRPGLWQGGRAEAIDAQR